MPDRGRAARVGRFVAVAGSDDVDQLTDRLCSRGYTTRASPHFRVFQSTARGRQTIVVHQFDALSVDEDLAPMVAEELGPLGVVASAEEYGAALYAIVASTCPASLNCPSCGRLHLDQPAIWRHYSLNTLGRLRAELSAPSPTLGTQTALFAAIYRRVMECRVGDRLLDLGCNLGVLPVLLAERDTGLTVVACDNRPEAVTAAADLAAAAGQDRVSIVRRDVLAADFPEVGTFDTVTAVHLLEHLDEAELPVALGHALDAAARRLIVSVPYEETAQPLYGHAQAVTPEQLRSWGAWCVERQGGGSFWCEDSAGGLLVVDRPG